MVDRVNHTSDVLTELEVGAGGLEGGKAANVLVRELAVMVRDEEAQRIARVINWSTRSTMNMKAMR